MPWSAAKRGRLERGGGVDAVSIREAARAEQERGVRGVPRGGRTARRGARAQREGEAAGESHDALAKLTFGTHRAAMDARWRPRRA
jgi:hypothetical protein